MKWNIADTTNSNFLISKTAKINVKKTFKFINGCKANNDTYKTANIFDSQQPQGT